MFSHAACGYSEEMIERYVMGRLAPQDATAIRGHSLHCPVCQAHLEEALQFIPAIREALGELILSRTANAPRDRRREARLVTSGEVDLVLLAPPYDKLVSSLRNISRSGGAMKTERAVAVDTPVEIRGKGACLSGIVRYCHPTAGSFEIGVELAPGSPLWPPVYLRAGVIRGRASLELVR